MRHLVQPRKLLEVIIRHTGVEKSKIVQRFHCLELASANVTNLCVDQIE